MRARFRRIGAETFRALKVRNFRLYFTGQILSVSGSWMQRIALALLILSPRVRGNGLDVGIEMALEFVPMTLFGTLGGVVADRVDKRKLIMLGQSCSGLLALALGVLTGSGMVTLSEIFVIAFLLGICTVFTNPTRQAFVTEMVGRELLPNAVSLNSVLMNSARVIGPSIAGVLIYSVGFAACFYVNAASYVAVVVALALMHAGELKRTGHVARARGQIREGLRYAWRTPQLRGPLIVVTIVGTFTYNFSTTLPLLSEFTYHGGAGTYSILTAAMGCGAVIGGLFIARRSRPSAGLLGVIGVFFGIAVAFVALVPMEVLTVAFLVVMGGFSIAFIATANATLQLNSDSHMRGRVMSLYAIAFLGSAPIGAPLVGWISDVSSPRVAIALGAAAAIGASMHLARQWRKSRWPTSAPAVASAPLAQAGSPTGAPAGTAPATAPAPSLTRPQPVISPLAHGGPRSS